MTANEEDESKKAAPPPGDRSITRRNLLRAGLTLGLISMVAGISSVAKSLFSPANPPSPLEAQTSTPTVTKTKTSTVTVTQGGGNQTASASSSASSSATSETTSTSSTSTTSSPFPQLDIANISSLVVSQPISFNYPLEETPNILVKLGVKAEGGVGPDGDIVAYSVVCQHLGCIFGFVAKGDAPACESDYTAAGPIGYCCCHGSVYDFLNGAKVTDGPAPRAVPQVTLSIDDSGEIWAVGMGPPTIFGHNTGSNDVLDDLQGGTVVSGQ